MHVSQKHSARQWMPMIVQTARGAAIAGLTLAGVTLIAGIILWDADFYTARDRWENFKVAMFGQWSDSSKLRMGHDQKKVTCYWSSEGLVGICVLKKTIDRETNGTRHVD